MTTAQIMATAARRHPAMKTRFMFRFRLVAVLSVAADLLRRRGPWEMKWFVV